MTAPRERDLPDNLNEVVATATELWEAVAKSNYASMGDVGSCILGDGIVMDYIPKGKRKPQQKMLISARQVAQCQGSLHYERGKDCIINWMKREGIEAYYNSGWMD